MRKHHYLGVALLWAAILAALLSLKACLNKRDEQIANDKLAPTVKEKIIVNPIKRTITVITEKGSKTVSLPDQPSSIEVFKSGNVKVQAPQTGFELVPFIGLGWSKQLNNYIGCDFYYWKRLDLGVALTFNRDLSFRDTSIAVGVSYAIYHNSRISLLIDNRGDIHGAITVRL